MCEVLPQATVIVQYGDGQRKRVKMSVGLVEAAEGYEATAIMDNLRPPMVFVEQWPIQAMVLAIQYMYEELSAVVLAGGKIFNDGGSAQVNLRTFFGRLAA